MDFKPQRLRARVFADENAAPLLPQLKTLHSRHKSQPMLKTALASNGPQKLGSRRAFGDVSNLAANKIIGDDVAARVKSAGEGEKVILKDVQKKADILDLEVGAIKKAPLRSAVSSIALRSNLDSRNNAAKISTVDRSRTEIPRPLRKSRTTLFQQKSKPTVGPIVIQQDLAVAGELTDRALDQVARTQSLVPASADVKPEVISELPELPELPELQELPEEQSEPAQLPHLVEPVKLLEPAGSAETVGSVLEEVETRDLVSEAQVLGPIDPALETTPALEILSTDLSAVIEALPLPSSAGFEDADQYESALEVIPSSESVEELYVPASAVDIVSQDDQPYQAIPIESHSLSVEPQAPYSATIPEPEEYWDVEEDDVYPDDGYVTARSFKSIGESQVSGNVTRTLYPHVDQAVRREIAAARALIESTQDPTELEDEAWDTSMVQEYSEEIFEYMRELEVRMSPNPHYMDKQTEIQWSMRSVLMDWIVQVHHRFGLLPETLFLCINLIDRFLSQKIVSLTKLQLVGATAIFVAAKYEEVDCPSVQEINFMVDNGYGVEEILKAERFMLSMLGFELGFPGPMSFLRRISKADDYDLETRTLAKYFLEITIMDERFLTCVPSFTAAGAHCLARMMLRKGNWSPAHVNYSNYTYSQLLPLISLMLECCEDPVGHHNAVYEKYLDRRYKQAAKYVQGEINNGFRIPDENVNVPSMFYVPTQQHYAVDPHQYPTYWPQVV